MDVFYGIAMSLHLGLEGNYNGFHPNAGLTSNGISIGAYYNSEKEISKYVSYEYELSEDSRMEIGIVDGYNAKPILPFVKYKYKNMFIAPAYEKHQGEETIGLLIGLEFKK